MVFKTNDFILSTNDFIIHKTEEGSKFLISLFAIQHNRDHTLASFNNESEREELFKKIMDIIKDKIHYVDLTLY